MHVSPTSPACLLPSTQTRQTFLGLGLHIMGPLPHPIPHPSLLSALFLLVLLSQALPPDFAFPNIWRQFPRGRSFPYLPCPTPGQEAVTWKNPGRQTPPHNLPHHPALPLPCLLLPRQGHAQPAVTYHIVCLPCITLPQANPTPRLCHCC